MDIGAGISGVLGVVELLKTVKDTNDAQVRTKAIIDIQDKLMGVMAAHEAAENARRAAEAKLAAMEDWNKEASRYALQDFGGGSFAYELKAENSNGEPPHRLCANCFTQGQKSILQFNNAKYDSRQQWVCKRCKSEFLFGEAKPRSMGASSARISRDF